MRLPFGSLRSTVLCLVALALLPAAGLIYTQTESRREAAVQQAKTGGRDLARTAAREFDKTVTSAAVLLKTISNLPQVRQFQAALCKPTLVEALESNPSFSNLGLVDATGKRICAAIEDAGGNAEIQLGDRPYFQEAMKRNTFWVGEYQLGKVTGEAVVTFAHPVRDDDGKPQGVLYAIIDLTALVDVAASQSLPPGTVVALFDRRGTVLARNEDGSRWVGRTVTWLPQAMNALEGNQHADLRLKEKDGDKYHFVRRLGAGTGEPGLLVSATVPLASVTRAADEELRTGLILVGLALLLTVFLVWISSSMFLVRPVRRMIEEFRLVEAGELREPGKPVTRRGEIGELADALERMVAGLQRRRRQRDRVLDALRQTAASLTAALDATQDGIFTLDDAGTILRVGPAALGTFRTEEGALVGADFATVLLAPKSGDTFREALEAARDDEESDLLPPRTELQALRSDGSALPLECTTTRIRGEGPERHTIYVRNLTHEKALTAQFLEAQKLEAVGRLAAGIAHDFNNALTVINGYGQLLEASVEEDSEIREYLARVRHAGLQAAGLVRRILSFSRGQGRAPVRRDINTLVEQVTKLLPPLVGEDVRVTKRLDESACWAELDPGQFEQLAANLAVNARDAMPSGGELTIATGRAVRKDDEGNERDFAVLQIEDTGVGIPEEIRDRIFDPFFSTKPEGMGTGLGLASCREIMHQHQGELEFDGGPEGGTIFRAYFPACEAPKHVLPADAPTVAQAGPSGTERILLVEDDPGVRELAYQVLRDRGYEVVRATDGEEALSVLAARRAEPFDLLVTDVIMPRLGGVELADGLAQEQPELPILFTSGYADQKTLAPALARPLTGLLPKPYATDQLARHVRRLLDQAARARAAGQS